MNPSDPPPKKRRLFTWRTLRRIVIVPAWAATIIILWYAVENWRGRRAWEQYRQEAAARGEHLDFDYFIPKPVPDYRNFAKAGPVLQKMFNRDPNQSFHWNDNLSLAHQRLSLKGDSRRHFLDLAAWEKGLAFASAARASSKVADEDPKFDPDIKSVEDPDPASNAAAAPGVLRGLQDCAPILEELRAASSRPEALFPVNWTADNPAEIALPHYSELQLAALHLRIRASAELALGRADDAMADLKLMFYLSDAPKNEPTLICGLVRVRMRERESTLIWEGLAAHRWTDAQLREIQDHLLLCNFIAEMGFELTSHRAGLIKILEYFKTHGGLGEFVKAASDTTSHNNASGYGGPFIQWAVPQGWFDLEKVNYCRAFEARLGSVFDPDARRIYPDRMKSNMSALKPLPSTYFGAVLQHRAVEALMAPNNLNDGLIRKFAGGQCQTDQAAIACGLERYWLAKGAYPTQLDELSPDYITALPRDPLTGDDYRYRRDSAQKFTLYSVGWDLKDDDGTPSSKPYGPDGDWVW